MANRFKISGDRDPTAKLNKAVCARLASVRATLGEAQIAYNGAQLAWQSAVSVALESIGLDPKDNYQIDFETGALTLQPQPGPQLVKPKSDEGRAEHHVEPAPEG